MKHQGWLARLLFVSLYVLFGMTACSSSSEVDPTAELRQAATNCDPVSGTCSSTCGDGACNGSETTASCPQDCPGCGDGICKSGETPGTCPTDCHCGDTHCNGGETHASCPQDCPACGNGICGPDETRASCPADCKCGDGTCGSNETRANCPADCKCGDGTCGSGETSANCPQDCPSCGDGTCSSPSETPASCATDCAACGDNICSSNESFADCPNDCTCGDGTCSSGETMASCPGDCTCGNGVCDSKENAGSCPVDCHCGDTVCNSGETTATCAFDCPPPDPPTSPTLPSVAGTGSLSGNGSVNRLGAYTYDVPIAVPPGRAGMAPDLAFRYASNVGEGQLGVGWSVNATSQIRRCRDVWARGQQTERVDFDGMTFCLDGEPLIVVSKSGTSAEYRKLQDRTTKIISDGGPAVNKPLRFVVYQANGRILEYGTNKDARADVTTTGTIALPSERLAWYLSYVVDRSSNAIAYAYGAKPGDFEHYVTDITYTGTRNTIGPNPYTPGLRRVHFDYATRAQPRVRYFDHRPESQSVQLTGIRTFAKDSAGAEQLIWSYKLDYGTEKSAATNRSLLRSLAQCDGAGICLNPTKFEYDDTAPVLKYEELGHVPLLDRPDKGSWTRLLVADLDGDGRDDVTYTSVDANGKTADGIDLDTFALKHSRVAVHLGSAMGFQPVADVSSSFRALGGNVGGVRFDPFRTRTGDFNGDGKAELLVRGAHLDGSYGNRVYQWDSGLAAFLVKSELLNPPGTAVDDNGSAQVMDLNGDGVLDLVTNSDATKRYFQLGAQGTFGFGALTQLAQTTSGGSCYKAPWAIDSDNDGRTELLDGCVQAGKITSYGLNKAGAQETSKVADPFGSLLPLGPRWDVLLIDVNGDGLRDALYYAGKSAGGFQIQINTGRMFLPPYAGIPELTPAANAPDRFEEFTTDFMRVADFNGDGLEDILLLDTGTPTTLAESSLIQRFDAAPELLLSDGTTFKRTPALLGVEKMSRLKHYRLGYSGSTGWATTQLADLDRDGFPEVVTIDKVASEWRLVAYGRGRSQNSLPSVAASTDQLSRVTPGEGLLEEIHYGAMTNSGLYTPGTSCTAPEYCVKRGMVMVSGVNSSVPGSILAEHRLSYSYEDGRANLHGQGFLGFKKIRARDDTRRINRTTQYQIEHVDQAGDVYPALGQELSVDESIQLTPDGVTPTQHRRYLVNRQWQNSIAVRAGPGAPFATGSNFYTVASDLWGTENFIFEYVDGRMTTAVVKSSDFLGYDAYGNWTERIDSTDYGETVTTDRVVNNDVSRWLLGMVRSETVESAVFDDGTIPKAVDTHTTSFDYWTDSVLLKTRTVEPNDSTGAEKLVTSFEYKQGLLVGTWRTDGINDWRKRVVHYNAEGIYPVAYVDELGFSTKMAWSGAIGRLASTTYPDGSIDVTEYDSFGRIRTTQPAGSAPSRTVYEPSSAPRATVNQFSLALAEQITTTTDGSQQQSRAYLDRAGRPVLRRWLDFKGAPVQSFEVADVLGRPMAKTIAYGAPALASDGSIPSSSAPASTFQFDPLDRPLQEQLPDGATTTYSYPDYLTDRVRDAVGNTREIVRNKDSRVIRTGTAGSTVNFVNGPFGRVEQVSYLSTPIVAQTTLRTKTITYDYDHRDRLILSTDYGLSRSYNPFGELLREESRSVVKTMTYDALGRIRKLTGTDTDGTQDVSLFTYDQGPNAQGKLASAVSGPGYSLPPLTAAPVSVRTTFGYDQFGRVNQVKNQTSGAIDTVDTTYDALGRIDKILYPYQGAVANRFGVQYSYNAYGYQEAIRNSASAELYWQVSDRTPEGLLAATIYGNGVSTVNSYHPLTRRLSDVSTKLGTTSLSHQTYSYYADGNLRERSTDAGVDNFEYDADDRVSRFKRVASVALLDRKYDYYPDGTFKTISNDSLDNGSTIASRTYAFQLTPGLVLRDSEYTYTYDTLGRQKTKRAVNASVDTRAISYTTFDLPKLITSGNLVTAFAYDAFQRRALKQTATSITRYFADFYERRSAAVDTPASRVNVYHVMSEAGEVAQVSRASDDATQPLFSTYTHLDALGSTSMVSNKIGQVTERPSYEPFGRRLSGFTPQPPTNSPVHVGFTGQEHDDEHGLINMRGRMYDPGLRRFVTRDPIIADPSHPQSYNPLSYVRNNPLKLTDPSGFEAEGPDTPSDLEVLVTGERMAPSGSTASNLSCGVTLNVGDALELSVDSGFTGVDFVNGSADGDHDRSVGFASVVGPGDRFNPYDQVLPFTSLFGEARTTGIDYTHPPDATPRGVANVLLRGFEGIANAPTFGYRPVMGPSNFEFAMAVIAMASGTKGLVGAARGLFATVEGGGSVLIDSNAVVQIGKDPTLGGLLAESEEAVVSYVTRPELRNAVALGRGLRGVPRALDGLRVLGERPSIDAIINFRGGLVRATGRFGDGIIGAQAVEFGIPLITNDVELAAAVRAAGGVVR